MVANQDLFHVVYNVRLFVCLLFSVAVLVFRLASSLTNNLHTKKQIKATSNFQRVFLLMSVVNLHGESFILFIRHIPSKRYLH